MRKSINEVLLSLLFITGFSAFCVEEAKSADKSSVIIMKNKDILHGALLSASPSEGRVLWQHPDSKTPFSFQLKNLREINFPDVEGKDLEDSSAFAVVLTNGDLLKGSIISMDQACVILKTSYAGNLKIDRRMLKEIVNTASTQLLFKGPGNINEWRIMKQVPNNAGDPANPTKVEFKDGCLVISGYEAYCEKKDMKLPEMARIEYTTTLGNDASGIIFFSDKSINIKDGNSLDSEIYGLNAYGMCLSRHSINAGRCRNGEWQSGGDSGDENNENKLRNLLNSSKVNVTIFANRRAGTINVSLNNIPVLKYIDQDSNDLPKGGGLCFIMTDNSDNSPILISNIRIGAWDGKLPSPVSTDEQVDKDTILFSNKDKSSGSLNSITNGTIQFDTEFAQLTIPLERIASILTSSDKRRQSKREINDIKAYFNGDDCVTVNISDIAEGKIRGRSDNFGEVTLDMKAFSRILFNVYDDNVKDEK